MISTHPGFLKTKQEIVDWLESKRIMKYLIRLYLEGDMVVDSGFTLEDLPFTTLKGSLR